MNAGYWQDIHLEHHLSSVERTSQNIVRADQQNWELMLKPYHDSPAELVRYIISLPLSMVFPDWELLSSSSTMVSYLIN